MPDPEIENDPARLAFDVAVRLAYAAGITCPELFDIVWAADPDPGWDQLYEDTSVCEGHSVPFSPPPVLGTYNAVTDQWGCDLRPRTTYDLDGHVRTGYVRTDVSLGAGSLSLAVSDGRLIEITVENASALLSDHVLFHAIPEVPDDRPF